MKYPDFRRGPSSKAEEYLMVATLKQQSCEKKCFCCYLLHQFARWEAQYKMSRLAKKKSREELRLKQKAATAPRQSPVVIKPANLLQAGEKNKALWSTSEGRARLRKYEKKTKQRLNFEKAFPNAQIFRLSPIPEEGEEEHIEEEKRCYDYFDDPHTRAHQYLQGDSQRSKVYARICLGSPIPREFLKKSAAISLRNCGYSQAVQEMSRLLEEYYYQ